MRWTSGPNSIGPIGPSPIGTYGLCACQAGAILAPTESGWDACGVGVRHVVVKDGALAMAYEAVDASGDHAVGLATSGDGLTWHRTVVPGRAAGGPVVRKGEAEDWDGRVVGTPYLVPPFRDAPWRLYYVGEAVDQPGLSIGVAECRSEPRSRHVSTWLRWWGRKIGHSPSLPS